MDGLLDACPDLIRVSRRIECRDALLLDELSGELQLRIAHLRALDTEGVDGLHFRREVQLVQRESVTDRPENDDVIASMTRPPANSAAFALAQGRDEESERLGATL